MEASGYPSHCHTDQEKNKYIERVQAHEGVTLCPDDTQEVIQSLNFASIISGENLHKPHYYREQKLLPFAL